MKKEGINFRQAAYLLVLGTVAVLAPIYLIKRSEKVVDVPSRVVIEDVSCGYEMTGSGYGNFPSGRRLRILTDSRQIFETNDSFDQLGNDCGRIERGEIGPGDIAIIKGPGIQHPLMSGVWVPDIEFERGNDE